MRILHRRSSESFYSTSTIVPQSCQQSKWSLCQGFFGGRSKLAVESCRSDDHLISAVSSCATTPLGHNSHTAGTISHQLPTNQTSLSYSIGGSLRADTWRKRKIGQVTPSTRERPTTTLELRLNFLVLKNDHHPIGP